MKKKKRKTGNGSFSFMDLMFGTLGAVVLLLIITLSLAGPPERIRDQVERAITWNIVAQRGVISKVNILDGDSDLVQGGREIGKTEQSEEIMSFVTLTTSSRLLDNEKSEYTIVLAIGKDELLEQMSELVLKFEGNVAFEVYSASVYIAPDSGNRGKGVIPKENIPPPVPRTQYELALKLELNEKEGNDGKMPEIKEFRFK